MGELLTAHRALEAVDCTSREDARLALRAVLCSDRADLAKFDLAFLAVYGSGAPLGQSPFDELGRPRAGGAAPCRARHGRRTASAIRRRRAEPGAGRVERRRVAAPQGLRHVHRRRDGGRAAADRAARPSRADPAVPADAAVAAPWPYARSAPRRARFAAHRGRTDRPALARALAPAEAGGARVRRVGIDDPVRPDAAPVPARFGRRPPARRGVRVRHAADPHHARVGRPRSRPRAWSAPPRR